MNLPDCKRDKRDSYISQISRAPKYYQKQFDLNALAFTDNIVATIDPTFKKRFISNNTILLKSKIEIIYNLGFHVFLPLQTDSLTIARLLTAKAQIRL